MKNSAKDIQNWFNNYVISGGEPYTLDLDQATAVADNHKNTLVTARAGSGKTRVIVAKIVYLIAKQNYQPHELTAFVFNRDAAIEINQRLLEVTVNNMPIINNPDVKIATTFHKFALDVLKSAGQKPKIISEDNRTKLIQEIIEHPRDFELTSQFINRAQQKFPGKIGYQKLETAVQNYSTDDDIKEFYLKMLPIYQKYCEKLQKTDQIDFNVLMYQAAKTIVSTPDIAVFEHALSKKKYLLIDEYQDFSYLFLNIIQKLRQICPSAHLFAVGDDWQAINRFAGSDCAYFLNFQDFFPEDAQKINLLTNYRSDQKIVANASEFMNNALNTLTPEIKAFSKKRGKIKQIDPTKTRFDEQDIKCDALHDAKYQQVLGRNSPIAAAKLLKTVVKIIQRNGQAEKILLLHRHNFTSFPGITMEDFYQALKTVLEEEGIMTPEETTQKINWLTIHRSKGLESNVVIILEADDKILFGEHPNGGLFEIFGDTAEANRADQNRLYYVALTRAKHKLYILSSKS